MLYEKMLKGLLKWNRKSKDTNSEWYFYITSEIRQKAERILKYEKQIDDPHDVDD